MCAQYWNLHVVFPCPQCGATVDDPGAQTHFMGDYSYDQFYEIGDVVPLLQGTSVILDGINDSFTSGCEGCGAFIDLGAEIINGQVVRVWPLEAQ